MNAQAVAVKMEASGIRATKGGAIAPFWGQNLRVLLSVVPHVVLPLAFRPGTRLRFAGDRAEILRGNNVELTLYLLEGCVLDAEVDAKYFVLSGIGRDTFEITAFKETERFRVVGTTNAPKPVVVEESFF